MRSPGREARRLRRAAERRDNKAGTKAELRGRTIPTTVEGFRQAIAIHGSGVIGNALISRNNQRQERLHNCLPKLQAAVLPTMTGFADFDMAIAQLQALDNDPDNHQSKWIEHLRWGLDSIATSNRFSLCMQMIGACVVARTQLERWSANAAFNIGCAQEVGESSVEFMRRVWEHEGTQSIRTWRSEMSADQPVAGPIARWIDAGGCFTDMSEVLHGRGPLMDIVWWESVDVNTPLSADVVAGLDTITDALFLCVHRVQAGLATAAEDAQKARLARRLWSLPIAGPLHGQFQRLDPFLWPVDLHILRNDKAIQHMCRPGTYYQGQVAAARRGGPFAIRDELGPALAFAERRTRALQRASAALKMEENLLGDQFDEDNFRGLTMQALLAAEMSAVLALWLRERSQFEPALALASCSTALRSAVWLWLEDDDRAMGCLRVLIEQMARARAWRVKPAAAAKLEARGETTPRDWIERCGWRRLGVLLRALGEFAHGANPSHWETARDVLVALNPNPDREIAQHSGRTNCVASLVVMLSAECEYWLADFDSVLAQAFWDVTGRNREELHAETETTMLRSWEHRALTTRGRDSISD